VSPDLLILLHALQGVDLLTNFARERLSTWRSDFNALLCRYVHSWPNIVDIPIKALNIH
jgi:hypothetical protein